MAWGAGAKTSKVFFLSPLYSSAIVYRFLYTNTYMIFPPLLKSQTSLKLFVTKPVFKGL